MRFSDIFVFPFSDQSHDVPTLNRKCTVPFSTPSAGKKRRFQEDLDDSEVEDGIISLDGAGEIGTGERQWQPLSLISEWIEPKTMTKRVTVCINLPSGVSSDGFAVRVLEGGEFLELAVVWPQPFADVDLLHRKWTTLRTEDSEFMSEFHPEMLGFEQTLKTLRERSTDIVKTITKISLPFPVETHMVSQFALAWRDDTTRAIYVRLRATEEDYAVKNNSVEFEVV